ncbi:RNA helicase Mov10l1-like [Orussus abietinus]|uniref:RNA helicase Mov10l1-like n=1 Tax=Orussus abietinus TaxID=222816 RepID=UPI0006254C2B|nr:RNA helicase Mov10l1-like [Orussus abietinus]XP_012278462.1 RNA helicase Mov10l1-like [Orussus abietinus]
MFSLVANAIKYVLGYNPDAEPDINEVLARIESRYEEPTSAAENVASGLQEGCFYKTGKVSLVTDDYVLIDGRYMCERINISCSTINVDDKVYYLAFQRNQDEEQKIRKILYVVDECWDDERAEEQVAVVKTGIMKRNTIGRIERREGRTVHLEPIDVSINLDKVKSEFIPAVGDWVQLESLVQIDTDSNSYSGEVLEVDAIQPLRSKLTVGVITEYNVNMGEGTIDKTIFFRKTSCEPGYIPCVGDKVVSDSIESDQGMYTWRSLTVVPLTQGQSQGCKGQAKTTNFQRSRNNRHQVAQRFSNQRQEDRSMYIPGVRPIKPPAFMAVKNGIFKVPQIFWNAVLNPLRDQETQVECEISVENAVPCLSNPLSFGNYKDRFHALLYLEEIGRTLDMQQYDINSAVMRHCGEYLVLSVPGLAEKRPSLLTGDRAIVSFKWDSSGGKLKYEGYIHKIKSSEVFLKFNASFHDTYNHEECEVTFKCSQSPINRCHTAINSAVNYLGSDFLFPNRVVEQEPQLDLEELGEEEPKNNQLIRNRSESISSSCSSSGTAAASDISNESIVRSPPRISVADRLFNAAVRERPKLEKPIVCVANETRPINHTNTIIGQNSTKRDMSQNKPTNNLENSDKSVVDPYVSQLKKRKLVWFNRKLNLHQKRAVRNILKGLARPLPYVIFGPPGTGKTITLCETILQILTTIPDSRLLVATPSNSSANLIAERLLDCGALKPGDMVRLIAHHCLENDSIPERLLPYCATGDLAAETCRGKTNHVEYNGGPKISCPASLLGRHRITIGTCIALGILHNMGFPRGHFSHILVDEAGQATEPEIMIPLSFVRSNYGSVILAGDPMQLGPVVQSKLALHFGLGESFLVRLLHRFPYQRDTEGFDTGYDPRLVTKLLLNYRSLPEILQIPNSLFYDSELRSQVSPEKSNEAEVLRLLSSEIPQRLDTPPAVVFHGVDGENHQDIDTPSWYNPEEASQVYLYLLKFYNCGIEAKDIGIITSYRKQVRHIRDLLLELDIEAPKVGSVEEFQGQERMVIILSTVRSTKDFVTQDIRHSLGFVASPKRLNVAITRARALLVIVGNPYLLSRDPYWRSLLIYCRERGAYTGCNFSPSHLDNAQSETKEEISKVKE